MDFSRLTHSNCNLPEDGVYYHRLLGWAVNDKIVNEKGKGT